VAYEAFILRAVARIANGAAHMQVNQKVGFLRFSINIFCVAGENTFYPFNEPV
jgi:hypothetical protein